MHRVSGTMVVVVIGVTIAMPSFAQSQQTKDPTAATTSVNNESTRDLPFSDRSDFEDASRGFVATVPDLEIKAEDGRTVWSLKNYGFLSEQSPPAGAVNPSLWRQARLNMNNGLFKVTDRIYQVRGFDISNLTIVEGDTGLIIIDTLTGPAVSTAAMNLYFQHRPRRPVVAVIYTHSHGDHFGGVKGVVNEEDVKSGKVKIFAPDGFMEHAVSENVYAGNAMSRRAQYMYGPLLQRGPRGQVDAGLGKNLFQGEITLIPPTDLITRTGETRTIDGVEIVFQMAPGTEAPAEMLMHFPQFRALCAAEDATHNLHNLYTLRGAEVRDAKAWWKTLNETIALFGDKIDVVFAQHHWPTWGQDRVTNFLEKQRDTYKYIHDQALRLMNQGKTMLEIAEELKLPDSLAKEWFNRGYYGSVSHNAKAVYQKYLGWYDSNPAHLHPLPPTEAGRKYVEFMGGAGTVIGKAREAFGRGEYRWVAQVMNHVVFAEPDNKEARDLAADALEQLGYQSENPTWRNEYLMGANELRNGIPSNPQATSAGPDVLAAMTVDMFLDYVGIRLNGPRAAGKTIGLNFNFQDTGEQYAVTLENAALTYTSGKQLPQADATVTLSRPVFNGIMLGSATLDGEVQAGRARVEGDSGKFTELFGLLDEFDPMFAIVTPEAASATGGTQRPPR